MDQCLVFCIQSIGFHTRLKLQYSILSCRIFIRFFQPSGYQQKFWNWILGGKIKFVLTTKSIKFWNYLESMNKSESALSKLIFYWNGQPTTFGWEWPRNVNFERFFWMTTNDFRKSFSSSLSSVCLLSLRRSNCLEIQMNPMT